MNDLGRVAIEALATGSISMTLGRSRLFREVRWWLARERRYWPSEAVWDFVKCPWCISHWAAMAIVGACGPVRLTNSWWLDWIVNWTAIVALAPIVAFLVYRCYGPLPPVPTEAQWNYTPDEFDEPVTTVEAKGG
jgi:hypothetical protein